MNPIAVGAGGLLLPVALVVGIAATTAGTGALTPTSMYVCHLSTTPQPDASVDPGLTIDGLDATQLANAHIIMAVAAQRGLPVRAAVIAVATALQESTLRNLSGGDRDSLGLFQQRPSQGWGTPAQILDPVFASNAFYDHLVRVANWETIPVTQAAQAVQRSAYPTAYAKWEDLATRIVHSGLSTIDWPTQTDESCLIADSDGQPTGDPITLPSGFTLPPDTPPAVVTAIAWALAQLGTPYSYGGDCTASHSGIRARQCDCSSLTQQSYKAAGIRLPRVASDQSHAGIPVPSFDQLRPGDLLFIAGADGSAASPGHVGMYIGQRLIIHAPHTGDVVKIANAQTWRGRIVAIRRIIS